MYGHDKLDPSLHAIDQRYEHHGNNRDNGRHVNVALVHLVVPARLERADERIRLVHDLHVLAGESSEFCSAVSQLLGNFEIEPGNHMLLRGRCHGDTGQLERA